uniref:Uncharacterized protein n=1 Tax=Ignisphaera aggregans TaxID=334771 RepID=A0A7C4H7J8_9CREN
MIKPRGCNASGHKGWIELKCRLCAKKLYIGDDTIYVCPKCGSKYEAYFCIADAKKFHMKCPYCGSDLNLLLNI